MKKKWIVFVGIMFLLGCVHSQELPLAKKAMASGPTATSVVTKAVITGCQAECRDEAFTKSGWWNDIAFGDVAEAKILKDGTYKVSRWDVSNNSIIIPVDCFKISTVPGPADFMARWGGTWAFDNSPTDKGKHKTTALYRGTGAGASKCIAQAVQKEARTPAPAQQDHRGSHEDGNTTLKAGRDIIIVVNSKLTAQHTVSPPAFTSAAATVTEKTKCCVPEISIEAPDQKRADAFTRMIKAYGGENIKVSSTIAGKGDKSAVSGGGVTENIQVTDVLLPKLEKFINDGNKSLMSICAKQATQLNRIIDAAKAKCEGGTK